MNEELFAALESLRHASVGSPEVALAVTQRPDLEATQRAIADLRAEINDRAPLGPGEGETNES